VQRVVFRSFGQVELLERVPQIYLHEGYNRQVSVVPLELAAVQAIVCMTLHVEEKLVVDYSTILRFTRCTIVRYPLVFLKGTGGCLASGKPP
jgi:hypothetical protein